jgi:hypothetical protein
MIWQLLKRDPAMKTAPMFVVMFALIAVGYGFLPALARAAAVGAIAACMIAPVFLFLVLQSQRGLYEAALPIDPRDLWLSRVLSLLAMIWLPLSVVLAAGLPRLPLFEGGAVCTVIVLAVKRVGIRELTAPKWLGRIAQAFFVCVLLMPNFFRPLKAVHWPALPSPGSVLAICLPAGVALFWWGWTSVPTSFQISPISSPHRVAGGPSGFAWSPDFLSIYGSRQMPLLIVLVFAYMASGHYGVGILAAIPQPAIRAQCRWLLSLPVSRRKLFALIAFPATAATILGFLASIFLATGHALSTRVRFVEVAAELAVAYFVILLSELPAWSRPSRLWAWVRWTPFVLALLAVPLAFSYPGVFQRLSGALPETWWQLTAVLAIPIIATYWLAEKAFMEQEYRQTYIETKNISRV